MSLSNSRETGSRPAHDAGLIARIDHRLDALLSAPAAGTDPLAAAMRYAVLGPGKRVRAVLALMAGREHGVDPAVALEAGCAVELMHAASLVFDDLPAMDDAPERRGRPSTHRAHGEALAMLAAIGLISRSITVIGAIPSLAPAARGAMVDLLARAIGAEGLAGGQLRDLHDLQRGAAPAGLETLNQIGRRKTGALFVAAVQLGAAPAVPDAAAQARLRAFGLHLGLAFQIGDDLLDADEDEDRGSYAGLLGAEGALGLLRHHVAAARSQLSRPDGPLGRYLDALFATHAQAEPALPP